MKKTTENVKHIFKKEFRSYFYSPIAYIVISIFLLIMGWLFFSTFFLSDQASMVGFFGLLPPTLAFIIPAVTMRLFSEEMNVGTYELLLTLPVTFRDIIVGKFLAAWLFVGLALLLTFPTWLTVNYLGNPDNGVIAAAYIGSWLMAGGFLAIGSCLSALTRNQVVAFILSVVVCFGFLLSGLPMVMNLFSGWAPQSLLDLIADFSFLARFASISKGILDLRDLLYFVLVIVFWLMANTIILELRKAD